MGGKVSKCIPYEEAVQRLTPKELEQLKDSFNFFERNGYIDRNTVMYNIIGPISPVKLSDQFYDACGASSSKGLGFKELVSAVVVLTRGSAEERMSFAFNVFDVSKQGDLTLEDVESCLNCTYEPVPKPFSDFFRKNELMKYPEFAACVQKNKSATSMIEWIFLPPMTQFTDVRIPTYYQTLAKITHLSEKEVAQVDTAYSHIRGLSSKGMVDAITLLPLLCPPLTVPLACRLCFMFDADNDGAIGLREMVNGLSATCRAPLEEKLKFYFEYFDVDEDGRLNESELLGMCNAVTALNQTVQLLFKDVNNFLESLSDVERSTPTPRTETLSECSDREDEGKKESKLLGSQGFDSLGSSSEVAAVVSNILSIDWTSEGASSITVEQFIAWATKTGYLTPLIEAVVQICTLSLGIMPSSTEEESTIIMSRIKQDRAVMGHKSCFIVSHPWWCAWKQYAGATDAIPRRSSSASSVSSRSSSFAAAEVSPAGKERARPDRINNSALVRLASSDKQVYSKWGHRLKRNVVKDKDYSVLSKPVFAALSRWYGVNFVIERPIVQNSNGQEMVELYPLTLKIMRHLPSNETSGKNVEADHDEQDGAGNARPPKVQFYFYIDCSRTQSVEDLLRDIVAHKKKMSSPPQSSAALDDLRLWDYRKPASPVLLELSQTVEDVFQDGQQVLLEQRNSDLTWPSELYLLAKSKANTEVNIMPTKTTISGVTGLSNLGNTCYLNTAIQCLSSTTPLSRYFLSGCQNAEINTTNPLGSKGLIARRYADLVRRLWSGKVSIAPVKLRKVIAKKNSFFNDYQQHDSQEFLACLIDGLHEDLNRVTKKPYVERKDSDGRPDTIVAAESWDAHVKRERSLIVDLFQGLLKSRLRCLQCGFTSVTFDPFTFLTLQLPAKTESYMDVKLYKLDGSPPMKVTVSMELDSTVEQLKTALSELCGIDKDCLAITEGTGSYIQRIPSDDQKLRGVTTYVKTVYETAKQVTSASEEKVRTSEFPVDKSSETITVVVSPKKPLEQQIADAAQQPQRIAASTENTKTADVPPPPSQPKPSPSQTKKQVNTAPNRRRQIKRSVPGHAIALHRKIIRPTQHFLVNHTKPVVFGTPILVPLTQKMTGNDLYGAVWKQVTRFVDSEYRRRVDVDDVPYPFTLTTTNQYASACSRCAWNKLCNGCSIPADNTQITFPPNLYLAIDWDIEVIHLHYLQSEETKLEEHESRQQRLKSENTAITLEECLQDFTKEEELDESWYCSKCKKHQKAAKKMDIWSLPNFLIIHFKRFQNVNGAWVKSNKRVTFPTTEFRPPQLFMAEKENREDGQDLPQTAEDDDNADVQKNQKLYSGDREEKDNEMTPGSANGTLAQVKHLVGGEELQNDSTCDAPEPDESSSKTCTDDAKRNQGEISEDPDGGSKDFSNSHKNTDENGEEDDKEEEEQDDDDDDGEETEEEHEFEDPHAKFFKEPTTDRVFDLYAVSSHLGVLGGGHYVAYAEGPDERWYLFNDSTCKPVTIDQVAKDQKHAYMLFYKCRGLDFDKFLPNIDPSKVVGMDAPADEAEQMDRNMKDTCAVS